MTLLQTQYVRKLLTETWLSDIKFRTTANSSFTNYFRFNGIIDVHTMVAENAKQGAENHKSNKAIHNQSLCYVYDFLLFALRFCRYGTASSEHTYAFCISR